MINLVPGNSSMTEMDFNGKLKCTDKSDKNEFLNFHNKSGFIKA